MTYNPNINADIAFSTTDVLADAAVYSSGILSLAGDTQVQTEVLASHDGSMEFIFYSDAGGTDIVRSLTVPYTASDGFRLFGATTFGHYVQYKFTNNSGSLQTDFYFATKRSSTANSPQLLAADAFISPAMIANLNRSVLVGQDKVGSFRNTPVDTEGHLKVNIQDPLTAFGDLRIAELTPQVQLTFPYNINTDLVTTTLVSGGTVTQADSMAVLQTSTSGTGSAYMASRQVNKYRAGLGGMARFTGLFTTGVANSTQRVGIGDDDDGFYFGYNGVDFGLLVIKDGTPTWTPQTSWNVDNLSGNNGSANPTNMLLDPTKINVFQIQYQWLGAGEIIFSVEDPADGRYNPVHRIQYANTNTTPSVYNPNLPMSAKITNAGNTSNLTLKSASLAGFVEGKSEPKGVVNSYSATSTHSTETAFYHLRNKGTYVTLANRINCILKTLSVGNDANTLSTFRIYRNATLAGTPTWVDINGNDSVMEVDTVQTYSSGGKLLYSGVVGKDTGVAFSLADLNIIVSPTDIITVTSESSGSGAQAANLIWQEDF